MCIVVFNCCENYVVKFNSNFNNLPPDGVYKLLI